MNTQNFLDNGQNRFPLSTDTLDFMQKQTLLLQGLTQAFGDNYIINQPTTAIEGLIVIKGELLPFRLGSGIPSGFIAVITETNDIDANGVLFPRIRTRRHAIYVSTNQGGECYPKAAFFEIRKQHANQDAIPKAIGPFNIQINPDQIESPSPNTLNVRVEEGGIFHISGFFKPRENKTGTNVLLGNLPAGFSYRPKYTMVVPTMGAGYYNVIQNIQQPYNLRILPDGRIQYSIIGTSNRGWVWVSSRIDMLRYFKLD